MGERAMPDIMKKGGGGNQHALRIGEPEFPAGDIGQVHCPQRVLKPCMVCARVNKIREPQLPDIPESLEYGGIKDG